MEVKNYGHSIRYRLLNVAYSIKQPYMKILPRYFHERLHFRLSLSRYKTNFLLKGGALLYAHYNYEARPTVDIDFLGKNISHDVENIKRVFTEILSHECIEDGVSFDSESVHVSEITVDREYNGVRLQFIAHLDTIRMPLSMDVGFGDIVTPCPRNLEYPTILPNLPDVKILAYSLETVVAEKFEAMISLGEHNSRMKDFFDVYKILSQSKLCKEDLLMAIKNTFGIRKTVMINNHPIFNKTFYEDKSRNALWKSFLKKIKCEESIDFIRIRELLTNRLLPIYKEMLPEG